jgi:FMN phosphatase YigB (HAD superfamily)
MKKVIVTDCDGVLLDWEEGFGVWMEHNGHNIVPDGKLIYDISERYGMDSITGKQMVKQFNQSAAMGFLPPLRDAQYYVKLLSEKHQYKFVVLTSLSLDPYAQKLRERNLKKIFGNCFKDVICLDTGADKDEALLALSKKYSGCWWIEDKPANAEAGVGAGFRSILIEHGHNMNYEFQDWLDITVAKNWEEIYDIVRQN